MSGYAQDKSFAVVAETRRRWSLSEKQAVVAETETARVSAVARRHGVSANLVFRWRRELRGKPAAAFVPVLLPSPAAPAAAVSGGVIEIVLADGVRVRIEGAVETQALKRVLAALQDR